MGEVLESTQLVSELVEQQKLAIENLGFAPTLAIVTTFEEFGPISTYFKSKQNHAQRIGAGFLEFSLPDEDKALHEIARLNNHDNIHGIVMQTPLKNKERTDELCHAIAAEKDVDALGRGKDKFPQPTGHAVVELARHYTDNFHGIAPGRIAVRGSHGRLVGRPAVKELKADKRKFRPYEIDLALRNADDLNGLGTNFDVIITATSDPWSLKPQHLIRPESAGPLTIIDAGVGTPLDGNGDPMVDENGKLILRPDLHPDAFNLENIQATKRTKAVGPFAVALMFGNLIEAARLQTGQSDIRQIGQIA